VLRPRRTLRRSDPILHSSPRARSRPSRHPLRAGRRPGCPRRLRSRVAPRASRAQDWSRASRGLRSRSKKPHARAAGSLRILCMPSNFYEGHPIYGSEIQ
jgi:hypothetical protein